MANQKILIYAELKNGKLQPSSLELLTKARQIFTGEKIKIAFAVAGNDIERVIKELSESGVDAVYAMESKKLKIFNVDYYTAALMEAVEKFDPDVVLIPASTFGEELAPTLGLRLKTGVAAHCIDLAVAEDGSFVQMVPAFGGKVIGEIMVPKARPQIASIKPGMFNIETQKARDCSVEMLDSEVVEKCHSKIRSIKVVEKEPQGIPIEKADIVICGGFGIGNQGNWDDLERLAVLFGGAVGYTRPVVDEGWVTDEQRMIGTSGKTIRPKVYIGVGISGATHHICGIKDANVIISINREKDAEIFNVSDYKVVADGASVIKEISDLLEKQ